MIFQISKEQCDVCLKLSCLAICHYINLHEYIVLQNEMLAFNITSETWNSLAQRHENIQFKKNWPIQMNFQIGVFPRRPDTPFPSYVHWKLETTN